MSHRLANGAAVSTAVFAAVVATAWLARKFLWAVSTEILLEYEEVLANPEYTPYEQAVEFMGTDGKPGKLHGIFDEVMQLNLENGAADTKLEAAQQIDNSVITDLFEGHTR